jgi:hypothetical protein
MVAHGVEQDSGADDVGLDENGGAEDGAIDVGFGGEMDDRIDGVVAKERIEEGAIGDVTLDELIGGMSRQGSQIGWIPRIGQGIENKDGIGGMVAGPMVAKVCADESGSSGD